jgi:lipopolysaccharide transport system permease protein
MNNKFLFRRISLALLVFALGIAVLQIGDFKILPNILTVELQAPQPDNYQIYYDFGKGISEAESKTRRLETAQSFTNLVFKLPTVGIPKKLRIDLGMQPAKILLKSIRIESQGRLYRHTLHEWDAAAILRDFKPEHDIASMTPEASHLLVQTTGIDAHLSSQIDLSKIFESLPKHNDFAKNLLYFVTALCAMLVFFIESPTGLTVNNMARFGELILYKTYADLRAETERTYLGFLWWIFEPIMYMSVFYIMFGLMMGHRTDDYVPFLLVGLTIWQWFKSCLSHGSESILGAHGLITQIYLPKVIFPIILIFSLLVIFLWLYGYSVTIHYLALPILFFVQLLFTTSLTFILAAVVPFLPDLRFVVENVLQAVFFISGVFVAATIVPEEYLGYYYLNPMTNLIEDYRNVLMYAKMPDWSSLLVIMAISVLGIIFGAYLIKRFEHIYPKVMP